MLLVLSSEMCYEQNDENVGIVKSGEHVNPTDGDDESEDDGDLKQINKRFLSFVDENTNTKTVFDWVVRCLL